MLKKAHRAPKKIEQNEAKKHNRAAENKNEKQRFFYRTQRNDQK